VNARIELHAQDTQADVVSEIVLTLVRMIATRTAALNNFHLALTGGRVGTEISKALISHPEIGNCKSLHLWFSDERFSQDVAERNDSVLMELDAGFKPHIHRVPGPNSADTVEESAELYAAELEKFTSTRSSATNMLMDVTLLSVGPDGHIASLFPDSVELVAQGSVIGIANSPKPPSQRVTWTMATINSSEQVWLIATGQEKRPIVDHLLAGTATVSKVPARGIKGEESTKLFVDSLAFASEEPEAEDFI